MKKEEEYCCEDLPWYMSCQGFSDCLSLEEEVPGVASAAQETGPDCVTAADCENNVDQAGGDVHHFLLVENKDVW